MHRHDINRPCTVTTLIGRAPSRLNEILAVYNVCSPRGDPKDPAETIINTFILKPCSTIVYKEYMANHLLQSGVN